MFGTKCTNNCFSFNSDVLQKSPEQSFLLQVNVLHFLQEKEAKEA